MTLRNDKVDTVQLQIQQLHQEFLNIETEGLLGNLLVGWWLGPVKFVADPVLGVAETVVPSIAHVVPFSKTVLGWSLGGVSNVGHLAHTVGTKVGLLESHAEKEDDIDSAQEFRRFLNGATNDFYTILGFGTGVVLDLVSAVLDKEKLSGWFQTVSDLNSYLQQSGIGTEVHNIMLQLDFVPNLILLGKAQAQSRKIGTGVLPSVAQLEKGYHFMKYATASYGIASIKAALAQTGITTEEVPENTRSIYTNGRISLPTGTSRRPSYIANEPHEIETLKSISLHIGVPTQDIVMFAKPGGSNDILRHFVAVDRAARQVILAIRGTFSVSEIVIDVDADSRK